MKKPIGRYSGYIRPFSVGLDLFIINILAWMCLCNNLNVLTYHIFISVSWIAISWNIDFYEVYRFTKEVEILGKSIKQYLLFALVNFAYLGLFIQYLKPVQMLEFVTYTILLVLAGKFFVFYFLKRFRVVFGGNFRRVVVVGSDERSNQLTEFFNQNLDYGYQLVEKFVLDQKTFKERENNFNLISNFVKANRIDEIYCSLSDLGEDEVKKFIDFTDNNLKVLKFLPSDKEILSGNMIFDYYGYIPVVSQRIIPLEKNVNKLIKRLFDVVFSLIIIICILSWLVPIIAILIKTESKGPVFFKQKRNGLNYHEFECFKFRSMKPNSTADLMQVSKNDPRITKLGAFLRKSSLDELPQFFNVLVGDMSVVGPRPHMVSETKKFAKKVDKFMVRHFIKPGITGLAQINGYRGEVETEKDIINRVKYDIFYIENWSMLLDVKIISQTVITIFKGDKKAY